MVNKVIVEGYLKEWFTPRTGVLWIRLATDNYFFLVDVPKELTKQIGRKRRGLHMVVAGKLQPPESNSPIVIAEKVEVIDEERN